MNIISVKQLRENFGQIKEGVENGLTYLLIYRSRPLAEIRPIKKTKRKISKKATLQKKLDLIDKLAGGFKLGKGLTPKKMNELYNQSYAKLLS